MRKFYIKNIKNKILKLSKIFENITQKHLNLIFIRHT